MISSFHWGGLLGCVLWQDPSVPAGPHWPFFFPSFLTGHRLYAEPIFFFLKGSVLVGEEGDGEEI